MKHLSLWTRLLGRFRWALLEVQLRRTWTATGIRCLITPAAAVAVLTLSATAGAQVTNLQDYELGFSSKFEWCKKLGEDRTWLTSTTSFGGRGAPVIPQAPVFTIWPGLFPVGIDMGTAWAVPDISLRSFTVFQEQPISTTQPGGPSGPVVMGHETTGAFVTWASWGRDPVGFLEFRSPDRAKTLRYRVSWWENAKPSAQTPLPLRETPLALGMIAAQRSGGSSANQPLTFRLDYTGCRPKEIAILLDYYPMDPQHISFRASASGPQQAILEIDSRDLSRRVNGTPPRALEFQVNGRFVGSMPLDTRIEMLGLPSPNRIDMDRKRCTFPIELQFIWDRPARVQGQGAYMYEDLNFSILNSGRVTNVGRMRFDVPLAMVLGVAGFPNPRIQVAIKGSRDLQGGGGILFPLPIVNMPANLASAIPSGGCP